MISRRVKKKGTINLEAEDINRYVMSFEYKYIFLSFIGESYLNHLNIK